MATPNAELRDRAEDAMREADGDWEKAAEILRARVGSDEALRSAYVEKAMADELRGAAKRLGTIHKICRYCAEQIAADAVKCKYCGEWLNQPAAVTGPAPATGAASSAPVIRHFTLLTGWILIVLIILLIITFVR